MIHREIQKLVDATPFIDTHEHLLEESQRVQGKLEDRIFPCNDWAYLFTVYFKDDLATSGMKPEVYLRFTSPKVDPQEKFQLIAPFWEKARHTGYGQSIRETLRGLYHEEDLTAKTAPRIAAKYHKLIKRGFYKEVLQKRANIECCQVNSPQRIFMETEQPRLLLQDLNITDLSRLSGSRVLQEHGELPRELNGWLKIVDGYFAKYGPKAVAVKNTTAYSRRLNFDRVTPKTAAAIYRRIARGEKLTPEEAKPLEDFLCRYCIEQATKHNLPVKFHTGFYAGVNYMPLARVKNNARDLCNLLQDFPDTKFVLFHTGYPYQDEFIALAKHYSNVYIDLCWTWIIGPLMCIRFLKEFLTMVPSNKITAFGGDYWQVENVYGHAKIARRGIAQTLSELVDEGWLRKNEVAHIAARIMHQNARELYGSKIPKSIFSK
jgi:uncharacterized protein